MKGIFYLLTILFLSLLISCSEEPPISVDIENLNKKPIKDPPITTEPLVLLDDDNQIVGISSERKGSKIKVWTYGGGYTKTWTKETSDAYEAAAIGDVDNDGHDELVAIRFYQTGKGRNKTKHYEIQVFENEATEPTRISPDFGINGEIGIWYMTLGDANNDGTLEIVVAGVRYIHVFKDNGSEVTELWQSENVRNDLPFCVDVGDADNNGFNEIVYAGLSAKKFGVYKYLGGNVWGDKVYSAPSSGGLDRAIVADVDGDGFNEIIGGGNYNKLTVWEYVNGEYNISFESEDLGGYTQGIAAGDFDGSNDGKNEIAVGTAGSSPNKVFVFKHDGSSYVNIFGEDISTGVVQIFAGDSDNDGVDEFTVGGYLGGAVLYVYKHLSGDVYGQVYSDTNGAESVYVK